MGDTAGNVLSVLLVENDGEREPQVHCDCEPKKQDIGVELACGRAVNTCRNLSK